MYEIRYRTPACALCIVLADEPDSATREVGKAFSHMGKGPHIAYEAFSKYADWLIDDPSEPLELEGLVISYIPNMTVAEWEAKHFPQPAAEQQ